MGLDPAQLKLNPQWLPFYRSGLRYILRPESSGADASLEQGGGSCPSRDGLLRRLDGLSPPYTALITYWNLCFDLAGAQRTEQSAQREELFGRMLSSLAWPGDEYVFWPNSICPDQEVLADAGLFWHGMRTVQPRYVLIFGREAATTVFPDFEPDSRRMEIDGVTFVFLPDPEEMLPDNRKAKNLVWHELKSLPIASLR